MQPNPTIRSRYTAAHLVQHLDPLPPNSGTQGPTRSGGGNLIHGRSEVPETPPQGTPWGWRRSWIGVRKTPLPLLPRCMARKFRKTAETPQNAKGEGMEGIEANLTKPMSDTYESYYSDHYAIDFGVDLGFGFGTIGFGRVSRVTY